MGSNSNCHCQRCIQSPSQKRNCLAVTEFVFSSRSSTTDFRNHVSPYWGNAQPIMSRDFPNDFRPHMRPLPTTFRLRPDRGLNSIVPLMPLIPELLTLSEAFLDSAGMAIFDARRRSSQWPGCTTFTEGEDGLRRGSAVDVGGAAPLGSLGARYFRFGLMSITCWRRCILGIK